MVPAGAPLVDIGDPRDLEVVADLLSTDAVQIKPGAPVRIDGWGGSPIQGRVTRVDPAGFLKVSALGIEEQRVRTIIDFVDPPEAWSRLGHDYRVIVHVTVWSGEDVLRCLWARCFGRGDDWAVFAAGRWACADHARQDRPSEQPHGGSLGRSVRGRTSGASSKRPNNGRGSRAAARK